MHWSQGGGQRPRKISGAIPAIQMKKISAILSLLLSSAERAQLSTCALAQPRLILLTFDGGPQLIARALVQNTIQLLPDKILILEPHIACHPKGGAFDPGDKLLH